MITTVALTKRYGRRPALSDMSVTIPPGGITALTGPNGAGKSTLIKLCIGFERPTSGRLEVLGVDPVRHRDRAVAMLGYVPQTPSLYRDISVEEHLALAAALRSGFDVAHARDRLRVLEIPLRARAAHLSGGQQAQVSLAIALGTRAPLLLLDEPLASLDPLARRDFLRLALDAARGGDVSIVLSSHVIREIEDVADRLLVLGEGRVLFWGTVADSVAGHRVTDAFDPAGTGELVAAFPGRGASSHFLVRSSDQSLGRAPDMEEVVLGYLAAARASAAQAGGADAAAETGQ